MNSFNTFFSQIDILDHTAYAMNLCTSCRRNRRGSSDYDDIGNNYSESTSLVGASASNPNRASDDLNLWSNPNDFTHTKEKDDRELAALLEQRENAITSSAYQIANDQIERIRINRRKVQDRWKSVLRELGFNDEDELQKLVTVTPLSRAGETHFSMQADSLHSVLVRETMIFGQGPSQRSRYATVMSRLIDLDTAYDFVEMAKGLYPQLDPEFTSGLQRNHHQNYFENSQLNAISHKEARQTNGQVSYSANNNDIRIKGDEYL